MTNTGRVNETYLSDLHARETDEEQTGLGAFTETNEKDDLGTTIAVVTDPTGGITDVTDEFIPELGMPEEHLNNIRQRRTQLGERGLDDTAAHNQAVNELDIERKYREYLKKEQNSQIQSLVERVRDGETITLVCFEKRPKWCHRHVLTSVIQNELEKT